MENGFIVKTEKEIIERTIDFIVEIQEWLTKKGYQRVIDCIGVVEYKKGLLAISPDELVTNGGFRFSIHEHIYTMPKGDCYDYKDNTFMSEPFEERIAHFNKDIEQAYNDMREFYNRWINGIKERNI